MTQGMEVYQFIISLLVDIQGKIGRLDQEEARSQEFYENGEVEEENEDGEKKNWRISGEESWSKVWGHKWENMTSYFVS